MQTTSGVTYQTGAAIVPSDTTLLNVRGIYVGVTGNISLLTAGGNAITLTAVLAGTILPIETSRINATGTTATSLVGLA